MTVIEWSNVNWTRTGCQFYLHPLQEETKIRLHRKSHGYIHREAQMERMKNPDQRTPDVHVAL